MSRTALLMVVVALMVIGTTVPAVSQSRTSGPIVMPEVKHDISPPVRNLMGVPPKAGNRFGLPEISRTIPGAAGNLQRADSLVQKSVLPDVRTTNLLNFDGIAADGFAPPDTNGSVGSTQFVETINIQYAVYDKATGTQTQAPRALTSVYSGFGGVCQTGSSSDPVVLWDKAAQRWLISYVAFNSGFTSFMECIAVSTGPDATGTYNRYAFDFGRNLNDYPKIGVWPDAYYASYNTFQNAAFFIGAEACAYDRTAMLAGGTATSVCFQKGGNDFGMLPADVDGNTQPPAGATNPYMELGTTSTTLNRYQFHVDFVNTANSTFAGPTAVTITTWKQLCPGTRSCITQPSPGEKVDSLGDRLMFRNAYRNFGGHETLVLTHSVDKGAGIAGARWYEIRDPNGTPVVFQSGTVASSLNFWLGSIAMDKRGDIALGFNVSSATVNPSVAYVGRTPNDPPGTMESPNKVVLGGGTQQNTSNRWGDYASMSIDPADDCTFWASNEYIKTNGSFNWKTRVVSFKFNACQ